MNYLKNHDILIRSFLSILYLLMITAVAYQIQKQGWSPFRCFAISCWFLSFLGNNILIALRVGKIQDGNKPRQQ